MSGQKLPPGPASDAPALTARELEALRWTMEGKTAWEVGALLGVTERTADTLGVLGLAAIGIGARLSVRLALTNGPWRAASPITW